MIVNCPACEARYRIPEDKIKGKGARITCPKCSHKFAVYRGTENVVVGGEPHAARGVPVTIARGGQVSRAAMPDEDDDDAPTTVMPQGSHLIDELREKRAAAAAAREAATAKEAPPGRPILEQPPEKTSSYTGVLVAVILVAVVAAVAWYLMNAG